MKGFMRGVVVISMACGLAACAVPNKKSSSTGYVITTTTQYYKNSPAQPMPPDGTFQAGTSVTIVKKLGNYTLVRAADGTQGYVPTADVARAK